MKDDSKSLIELDGSSAFQVVFTPGSKQVKAAPRLCVCVVCEKEYGSCPLFNRYDLQVGCLKETSLHSSVLPKANSVESNPEVVNDFLLPGSVCAIAADRKSTDTVWFIKIIDDSLMTMDI